MEPTLPHVPTGSGSEGERQGATLEHRYRLQRELGRGGFGVVYRGHDSSLDRPVALKLLHPRFAADADVLSRLRKEARALIALRHGSIIQLLDAGEYRLGVAGSAALAPGEGMAAEDVASSTAVGHSSFALVFEFVEGEALDRWIDAQAPVSLERALPIIEQLADALTYAHTLGIVHRDVKPANVILARDAAAIDSTAIPAVQAGVMPQDIEWTSVKLLDFGIAKLTGSDVSRTAEGVVLGTPAYMSPEQIAGSPVDAGVDTYALATMLYQMLTGLLPFEAAASGDFTALLRAKLQEEPRPLHAIVPGVDERLEAILARALARDAASRFRTPVELVAALRRLPDRVRAWSPRPSHGPARAFPPVPAFASDPASESAPDSPPGSSSMSASGSAPASAASRAPTQAHQEPLPTLASSPSGSQLTLARPTAGGPSRSAAPRTERLAAAPLPSPHVDASATRPGSAARIDSSLVHGAASTTNALRAPFKIPPSLAAVLGLLATCGALSLFVWGRPVRPLETPALSSSSSPIASGETSGIALDLREEGLRITNLVRGASHELSLEWLQTFATKHRSDLKHDHDAVVRDLKAHFARIGILAPLSRFLALSGAYFADDQIAPLERWQTRSSLCDVEVIEYFCEEHHVPWPLPTSIQSISMPGFEEPDFKHLDFLKGRTWGHHRSPLDPAQGAAAAILDTWTIPSPGASERLLAWFRVKHGRSGLLLDIRQSVGARTILRSTGRAPAAGMFPVAFMDMLINGRPMGSYIYHPTSEDGEDNSFAGFWIPRQRWMFPLRISIRTIDIPLSQAPLDNEALLYQRYLSILPDRGL